MSKRWARKKKSKQKNTLRNDAYSRLNTMFQEGKGRSRKLDKQSNIDSTFIYSSRTYETYKANSKIFISWIIQNHPEVKHLRDCTEYANEWLKEQINTGYSPWTISTRKAAISKLLGIPYTDLVPTPSRCRAQIQRSRAIVERDKHISVETEKKYAILTSATGLRRNELLKVRGTDLRHKETDSGDVIYYLHLTRGTKGGRVRDCIIMGSSPEETTSIVNRFKDAGNALVCPHIHNAYDNHSYRAAYAKRLYGVYARPVDEIPKQDRYIMRKERATEILDRRALIWVSQNLGHSRADILAQSYLY